MNDTHIIDWHINTSIAVYFHQLLKEDFPLKGNQTFLDKYKLLDLEGYN